MQTSTNGIKFISQEEGERLTAYQDSVGVWTIGVGHTTAAGEPEVFKGLTISKPRSEQILAKDLKAVELTVRTQINVPLTQNQFDALVSLVFNIGQNAFIKSTLLKYLNIKDYQGAANEFLEWKYAGGQPILLHRRQRERALFLKGGDQLSPLPPVVKSEVTPKKEFWLVTLIKAILHVFTRR